MLFGQAHGILIDHIWAISTTPVKRLCLQQRVVRRFLPSRLISQASISQTKAVRAQDYTSPSVVLRRTGLGPSLRLLSFGEGW